MSSQNFCAFRPDLKQALDTRNYPACRDFCREFIQISAAWNKAPLRALVRDNPLNPGDWTRFSVAERHIGPSVAGWDFSPVQVGDQQAGGGLL